MYETDNDIVVHAELPGIQKEDVDISTDARNNTVKISGNKEETKHEEHLNCIVHERRAGRFERVFRLPLGVDYDKVSANMQHGVLEVKVPKPKEEVEEQDVRRIDIR